MVFVGKHVGFRESATYFIGILNGLDERLRFLGGVSNADLLEYISNADALIFVSFYEGFGLSAFGVVAAGCPVIASTSEVLSEVCREFASSLLLHISLQYQ